MKKSLIKRCANRVFGLLARFSPGSTTLRPALHRARGVRIGRGVFIGDDVYLDNEYPESIELQDGVQVSIRAVIIAHTRGPGKVIVEQDVFIGPHAVIACSAGRVLRIGQGAVISAGCIVTRSVAPRAVLTPAPSQVTAHATIPLPRATTMQEFWSGLTPLPPQKRAAAAPPAGPTPGSAKPPSLSDGNPHLNTL